VRQIANFSSVGKVIAMSSASASGAASPSANALLSALAELMSDDRLRHIAKADRGEDYEAHLSAVTAIRDTLIVPEVLEWVPREVLELTRWSRPEDWYAETNVDFRAVYEMRAFSCAALMLTGEDCDSWDSLAETLGNLMESLIRYRPGLLPLIPDALSHWESFDFHEADHAFRLAAELCVWLEMEDGEMVSQTLAKLLEMESMARKNTSAKLSDYGKPAAFAGRRSLIQAQGWQCAGKLIGDKALLIPDEEVRFLVCEIAAALQAIATPKR